MEIFIAKTAGFCFGVDRAIKSVYESINKSTGVRLYTYGPIIHNKEVIKSLEKKDVFAINSLDEVMDGKIIIRSHGVAKNIYDTISEKGLEYIDSTCPYVKKIHNIVKKASEEDKEIIIIGDKNHPEVEGIIGWSTKTPIVFETIEELNEHIFNLDKEYCLVIQTTFNFKIYNELLDILKKKNLNLDINNTICVATTKRQEEANDLSKNVDIMIVIGDKLSSNTRKLYEICRQNCKKTHYVETYHDLELNNLDHNVKIGITAGASTSSVTIKEVVDCMSEFEKNEVEDTRSEFEQLLEDTLVTIHIGQIVSGNVLHIDDNESISVDLGYKSDGVIERGEYSSDPNRIPSEELEVGDEIEVYVKHVSDREGVVSLSARRLEQFKGMNDIEKAYEEKTPISAEVVDIVKGGAIALFNGVRVFIPASQISLRFVDDLEQFRGQTLTFEIIEFDKRKRRIIGGVKNLLRAEYDKKRKELFAELVVGTTIKGIVSRITDFGAFVDLGGVDGLVHISELSWGRVKHTKDVLKEGQEIEVAVIDLNEDENKISLSLKALKEDPWISASDKYMVDSVVKGKVVRLVPFGAFVELEEGVDGLVHISQIANKHVSKPEEELTVGQVIDIKVLSVDLEKKQISLSKKAAENEVDIEGYEAYKASKIDKDEVKDEVKDIEEKIDEVKEEAKEEEDEKIDEVKEDIKEKAEDIKHSAEEKIDEAKEKAEEIKEDMKEKAEEIKEDIEEKAEDIKESAEEKIDEAKEKAEEIKEDMKEKAEEVKEDIKEKAEDIKDDVKEKAKEIKEDIKHKAKEIQGKIEAKTIERIEKQVEHVKEVEEIKEEEEE